MSFQIIQGDALTVLRSMESESVQTCITSPPYYGLRSYKTEPQIWDNHNGCQHVWGEDLPYAKQDKRTPEVKASQGAVVGNSVNSIGFAVGSSGNFCHCGAWRGELGLEPDFRQYVAHLLEIFTEVKRVLKPDGTCFVNLGDSYATHAGGVVADPMRASGLAGVKHQAEARKTSALVSYKKGGQLPEKCLMNIPHRVFIGMTDELQLIQRNNINWWKKACMPSSAKDRWTVDFESIGFFSKNAKYKFNQDLEESVDAEGSAKRYEKPFFQSGKHLTGNYSANGQTHTAGMKEFNGFRNARTTWDIPYEPSGEQHYASYPTKLAEKMILAGTDEGDTVLDIFNGTASTGHAAIRNRRKYIGIELNPDYIAISNKRLAEVQVKLF